MVVEPDGRASPAWVGAARENGVAPTGSRWPHSLDGRGASAPGGCRDPGAPASSVRRIHHRLHREPEGTRGGGAARRPERRAAPLERVDPRRAGDRVLANGSRPRGGVGGCSPPATARCRHPDRTRRRARAVRPVPAAAGAAPSVAATPAGPTRSEAPRLARAAPSATECAQTRRSASDAFTHLPRPRNEQRLPARQFRSGQGGKPVATRKRMVNEGETSAHSGYWKGVNDA
jgi:hypothetical protein